MFSSAQLSNLLASCPRTGGGVNQWIFNTACELHRRKIPAAQQWALLVEAVGACGRVVPPREIDRAIANSPNSRISGGGGARSYKPRPPAWPEPERALIVSAGSGGPTLEEFSVLSPYPISGEKGVDPDEVLDALFPGDPLICSGHSMTNVRTATRERLRGIAGTFSLIVPNPMSRPAGVNQEGWLSYRCLDNVGPRRFLVVECDFHKDDPLFGEIPGRSTQDLCAAISWTIWQATGVEPALCVHSGGKSLHTWFPVAGWAEEKVRWLMEGACRLGADRALYTPCQLARMPGGTRFVKGATKHQRVVYFDPEAGGGSHE